MTATTKKIFKGFSIMAAFVLLCFVFATPSCKKDTECKAIVTVLDSVGSAVSGASVRLFYNTTASSQKQLEKAATTDGSGKANFSFKLEATWDIEATSGAQTGTGIITLKPGETVEKTVNIK